MGTIRRWAMNVVDEQTAKSNGGRLHSEDRGPRHQYVRMERFKLSPVPDVLFPFVVTVVSANTCLLSMVSVRESIEKTSEISQYALALNDRDVPFLVRCSEEIQTI